MSRLLSLALFILTLTTSVSAQEKRIRNLPHLDKNNYFWGISLGYTNMGYRVDPDEKKGFTANKQQLVTSDFGPGLSIAAIGGMRFNDYFSLRLEPGALISESKLIWHEAPDPNREDTRNLRSYFFNLPLVLKFNATRTGNYRPYLTFGGGYSFNFTSNEKDSEDNVSGTFRSTTHNYFLESGFGIDIYLEYFKLSPAIKAVFGMNNALIEDDQFVPGTDVKWTDPISSLKTRGVFLTLTFE